MITEQGDLDAEFGPPIPDDEVSFAELLEAATSPPDMLLLRRYADAMYRRSGDVIGPGELQWIEANLASNPAWQGEWTRILEEHRNRLFGRLVRSLAVAASLLIVIGVGWFGAVRLVHVPVVLTTQSTTRSVSSGNLASDQTGSPISLGRIRTAWHLAPLTATPHLDTLLGNMKSRFEGASDRFVRSSLAFDIAILNELQGSYAVAHAWYDTCRAQGTENAEPAAAGIRRTVRRHSP